MKTNGSDLKDRVQRRISYISRYWGFSRGIRRGLLALVLAEGLVILWIILSWAGLPPPGLLPLFVLLLPPAGAFTWVWFSRSRDLHALREIDKRRNLKQRLLTARDQLETPGPYARLVWEDALDMTEPVMRDPEMFPRFYPGLTAAAVVGLAIVLFLSIIGSPFSRGLSSDPYLLEQARLLEEEAERLAARDREDPLDESRDLADDMRKLARQLQDGRIREKEAREEIRRLSEEVARNMEDLSRNFLAEQIQEEFDLDEGQTEFFRYRNKTLSPREAAELRRRLMESGRLSAGGREGVEQAFGDFGENPGTEEELRRRLEDVMEEEGVTDGDPETERLDEAARRLARTGEALDEGAEDEAGSGDREGPEGEDGIRDRDTAPGPGGDASEDPSRASGRESGSGRGSASERDEADESSRLGQAETIQDEVPGIVNRDKNYRTVIRSLSGEAESELDEQEILTGYRRELEAVIRREEIPVSTRDYIREYFLSIGLDSGEEP